MEISVPGSAGSEAPGQNAPAFRADESPLLDAGTVGIALDRIAGCSLTHLLLAHAHLDHFKGVPFLLDNLAAINPACNLRLTGGKEVLSDIGRHIFNNRIWPDFTLIPDPRRTVSTRAPEVIGHYKIVASRVNHTVPAYGTWWNLLRGRLCSTPATQARRRRFAATM